MKRKQYISLIILFTGIIGFACSQLSIPSGSNTAQKKPNLLSDRFQARCAADLPAGFDWPAAPESLYKISGGIKSGTLNIPGSIDVLAQRRHGWNLFAAITQPSTSGDPNSLPVFQTWYTVEEAF